MVSLLGLVLMFGLSGCEYRSEVPTIRNETDQTLTLYRLVGAGAGDIPEGTEQELTRLRPGNEYVDRAECVDEDFVVRTEDGTEFARRTERLCAGDPWILTEP
ncbi:MAG: hypothetical protein ACFCVC_19970 [Acidimicrobiia bacterium]